ncbi:DUF7289 family protein [Natrinema caseinilyticum]|uniref:DUF7289 family protein n=1 Tax=Natrinema caseinilyticum TaxID=2961570 RepID=UPI0020C3F51B|nr:hypothetical protein [Natrinema caseinilyticum]
MDFPQKERGVRIRGQSSILAVVLLIGMVATISVGIFLVGAEMMANAEHQSEQEKIEQSFVKLSRQMSSAAINDDVTHSMTFESGQSGAITKTNAGSIEIQSSDFSKTIQLGAIEYRGDDGSIVAYQAGGVWRERGNKTRMLSAPPINYDAAKETLWLSVSDISEEQELSSGEVTMVHQETVPLQDFVQNEKVTMTITSDYYRGWESYFRHQAGDAVVRNVDHSNRTVTVELGYLEADSAFDSGVTYSDDYTVDKNADVDGPTSQGNLPPLDTVISDMINDTETGEMTVDEDLGTVDTTLTKGDGTYVADSIEEAGHLRFNLTEGNATLIVDGDINAGGSTITVTDWDGTHSLKVYTTGDLDASNSGDICVDPCDTDVSAELIQVFGTSEMQVDFGPGGNSRFEGVLYAASNEDDWPERNGCESQVCIHSNPDVYGSIVASSVKIHAASAELSYDSSLDTADIPLHPESYTLPPRITYLNIAHHKIDVANG